MTGTPRRVNDLGHQGEGSELEASIRRQEAPPVALRRDALNDDRVDPLRLQPPRLIDRRRRGQEELLQDHRRASRSCCPIAVQTTEVHAVC